MVTQSEDAFDGTISFKNFNTSGDETEVTVGDTLTVSFKAILGNVVGQKRTPVSTEVFLYRNGEPEDLTDRDKVTERDKKLLIDDSTRFSATEQDIIEGSITTSQYQANDNVETSAFVETRTESFSLDFDPSAETREETLYLRMVSEYEFTGNVTAATTGELTVTVTPREEQVQELEVGDDGTRATGGEQRVQSAFEEHTDFALTDLTFEDGFSPTFGNGSEETDIKLSERYNRPRVAIDTAARFVDHEIIGGKKVRQRVGSDPIELSVNGVCQRPQANKIDQLHRVKTAQLQSERLPQEKTRLPVQIASTTTEPLEDGGAADARTGELLYTFTINAVEVIEE